MAENLIDLCIILSAFVAMACMFFWTEYSRKPRKDLKYEIKETKSLNLCGKRKVFYIDVGKYTAEELTEIARRLKQDMNKQNEDG